VRRVMGRTSVDFASQDDQPDCHSSHWIASTERGVLLSHEDKVRDI
jgi:hypothetical protein